MAEILKLNLARSSRRRRREERVSTRSFPLPRGHPAPLPAPAQLLTPPQEDGSLRPPPQPPVLAQVLPRPSLPQPSPGLHLWLTRDSVSAPVSCLGASGPRVAKLRIRGEGWRVGSPVAGPSCRNSRVAVAGCATPPRLGAQPGFRVSQSCRSATGW